AAFLGDAGTDHLGEAVAVEGLEPQTALDLCPHPFAPGLRTAEGQAQVRLSRVETLPTELIGDGQEIGRGDGEDIGPEIGDLLDLSWRLAAAGGDNGAAQSLRAVVKAKAAGEQAIAIGIVQLVARSPSRGADGARHEMRPSLDIAFRIADDGGLA